MKENEKAAGKKPGRLGALTGRAGNWFHGMQAEFKKIIWTDRNTLIKQTIVVTVVTVLLGVMISIMDAGILECINLLIE